MSKDIIKGTPVKAREDVQIVYTDKVKFGKKGDKVTVHRVHAENLVSKGFATIVK